MLIPKSSLKEQLFWLQGLNSAPKYTFQIQTSSQTCLQEISTSMHKRQCLPSRDLFFLFIYLFIFWQSHLSETHVWSAMCFFFLSSFLAHLLPLFFTIHFLNSFSLSVLPITLSMKLKLLRFIFIERKFTKHKINHLKWTT